MVTWHSSCCLLVPHKGRSARQCADMSDYFVATYLDQYDVVSMNLDRYVHSGHSGKGRTKREVREHTNRPDPSGHNRKTVQKLVNNVRKTRPFSGQA